jgi:cytochrome c biogenesis protein CcdA
MSVLATAAAGAVSGPVLYGFTLGLVGAVNPCGFPLLPAYLVVSAAEARSVPLARRAAAALASGAAATVGFLAVFGVLGAAVEAGGVALGWVPWVMVPVSAAMVLGGIAGAAGRLPAVHLPMPRWTRSRHRMVAMAGFGVAYALASLTCSLPVFLFGVAGAFTRQGPATGIPVAVAYALGMGLVVTAVSVAGASSQVVRLTRLRAWQPVATRVAAAAVAVVGAYLMLYWLADLVSPLHAPAPVRAVESAQATVAGWLSASPRLTGAVIGAMVVAVLAGAAVYGWRGERTLRAQGADGESAPGAGSPPARLPATTEVP